MGSVGMSCIVGHLVGVADLLGEGKRPTPLMLKQRKTGLLLICLSYLIFLPFLLFFLKCFRDGLSHSI